MRIYREDAHADDDWTSIVMRLEPVAAPPPEKTAPSAQLQNEWLVATIDQHKIYSVSETTTRLTEQGAPEAYETNTFFNASSSPVPENDRQ